MGEETFYFIFGVVAAGLGVGILVMGVVLVLRSLGILNG